MYVSVCVYNEAYTHNYTWKPKRITDSLRTEATGGCEPLDMDTGKKTGVLWKRNKWSTLLRHLSSAKNETYTKQNNITVLKREGKKEQWLSCGLE